MKILLIGISSALVALLIVVIWHTCYVRAMLRHLQQSLQWNDRQNLEFPTQRAYRAHCARQARMDRVQKGVA